MEPRSQADQNRSRPDVRVIRPELRVEHFRLRGEGMSKARLRKIRKALRTLHTLETMAQNIYKFQLTRKRTDLNRQLVAAMCNEMTHLQDFQVKLYEYGWKPSKWRWMHWIVGWLFGTVSRLRGRRAILRTGIWVESKAVAHYAELLETVEWEDDVRPVVEKNQADEDGHIQRWRALLEAPAAAA